MFRFRDSVNGVPEVILTQADNLRQAVNYLVVSQEGQHRSQKSHVSFFLAFVEVFDFFDHIRLNHPFGLRHRRVGQELFRQNMQNPDNHHFGAWWTSGHHLHESRIHDANFLHVWSDSSENRTLHVLAASVCEQLRQIEKFRMLAWKW